MNKQEAKRLSKCTKIAVMGGTFDPIHYGHLLAAEAVRVEFGVDLVLFVPSGQPPHKQARTVSDPEHRYLMTMLATADHPSFCTSRMEIDRPGTTYTIDTLRELRGVCGKGTQIFFITGVDAIAEILTWKDADKLPDLCRFIAVTRPGSDGASVARDVEAKLRGQLHLLDIPALAISSTDIRARVLHGKPIKYLLPDTVEAYITKNGLYPCAKNQTVVTKDIDRAVRRMLSRKRYIHTQGVAQTAATLAEHYGADRDKAYLAGLLHDCAKEIPTDEKIKMAKAFGIALDEYMKAAPDDLLHSFLGAAIATRDFGVIDTDVLNAIQYHTTGRQGMSLLEKILFTADFVEPNRDRAGNLSHVRKQALCDLDATVIAILKSKIMYSKGKKKRVHPFSTDALKYLQKGRNCESGNNSDKNGL